jgi:hypothetical protein
LKKNTVIFIDLSSTWYIHRQCFVQTLTTIDLGRNKVGDEGTQYLADALRINRVIIIILFLVQYIHV